MQSSVPSHALPWAERVRHPLLLLSGVGIALLATVYAAVAWQACRETLQGVERMVDMVDALAAATLEREIALYDLALRRIAVAAAAPTAADGGGALRGAMADWAPALQHLGSLAVVDATGAVRADLGGAGAGIDGSVFPSLKALTGDGALLVGRPFTIAQDRRVSVGRRVLRADGTFAGAILATLRLASIETALGETSAAVKGTITLSGPGGVVLAQVPAEGPAETPRDAAAPAVPGPRSDPWRIVSARPVGRWPLVLTTSVPRAGVLGPVLRRLMITALAIAVVLGAMLLFLARAVREISRRAAADRAMAGLAKVDSLTGLPNRRAFDERLDLEWRRAERDASHFSLLMLDGDCFKAYNDTFGHVAGDRCLGAIADTLRQAVKRPGDLAARYGGEEFAILLPATDPAAAAGIAEQVRQAVMDHRLPHPRGPAGVVTVSIGLATVKPRYLGHPMDLVRAADHALYEAKAKGRNRVVAADLPGAAPLGRDAA